MILPKVIALTAYLTCVSSVHLPPGIELCHRSDPKFTDCLTKTIQHGLTVFAPGNKEFGIPLLEPYTVKKIDIKGSGSETIAVDISMTNVQVYGLTITDIKKVVAKFEDDDCRLEFDVLSPKVIMLADFQMNGKLLMIPLNADGQCNVTQTNVLAEHRAQCQTYMKKGRTFLKVVNYTLNLNPERVDLDFTELFPDNRVFGEQIERSLKESTDVMYQELKVPMGKVFAAIGKELSNRVYAKIPLNEIFLD